MEQLRSAKAGDQRGAREEYDGNEGRTQAGSDGKEKERKLHFFSPSHHSFRPLSLTINSNSYPPKSDRKRLGTMQGTGWEGRGRLYTGYTVDHEG